MKVINIRALRMLSPSALLNIRPLAGSLMFDVRRWTLDVRRSTFDVRRSMFDADVDLK